MIQGLYEAQYRLYVTVIFSFFFSAASNMKSIVSVARKSIVSFHCKNEHKWALFCCKQNNTHAHTHTLYTHTHTQREKIWHQHYYYYVQFLLFWSKIKREVRTWKWNSATVLSTHPQWKVTTLPPSLLLFLSLNMLPTTESNLLHHCIRLHIKQITTATHTLHPCTPRPAHTHTNIHTYCHPLCDLCELAFMRSVVCLCFN